MVYTCVYGYVCVVDSSGSSFGVKMKSDGVALII